MEHVLRSVDLSSNVWEGLACVAGVKRGRGRGDLGGGILFLEPEWAFDSEAMRARGIIVLLKSY